VSLAAHQQRPLLVSPLQVTDVGARDLDRAQHLQAEQRQQRLVAQVLDARISLGVVLELAATSAGTSTCCSGSGAHRCFTVNRRDLGYTGCPCLLDDFADAASFDYNLTHKVNAETPAGRAATLGYSD
jgi:hypothetical protein